MTFQDSASRRQPRGSRTGAATVEFALVAPLFLLLLAGIIEFGQAFRIEHSLTNAVRHGARAAIVQGALTSQVVNKVRSDCNKHLGVPPGDVNVTVAVNGNTGVDLSDAEATDEISVTASISYAKVGVGFFSNTFAKSNLSSTCTLERE
ncbi:MAG TPA: TadE/TadG family type IV pilus assembly protein [Planctomycetaceae bacterium]|nr:TadE/TadG family type IV pilus assembly protein [Planctomycetaceae bacterium]